MKKRGVKKQDGMKEESDETGQHEMGLNERGVKLKKRKEGVKYTDERRD